MTVISYTDICMIVMSQVQTCPFSKVASPWIINGSSVCSYAVMNYSRVMSFELLCVVSYKT